MAPNNPINVRNYQILPLRRGQMNRPPYFKRYRGLNYTSGSRNTYLYATRQRLGLIVSRLAYPTHRLLILKSKIKDLFLLPARYVAVLLYILPVLYAFHQLTDDGKPIGIVFKDIRNAEKNISNVKSIPGPAKTTVDVVNIANTTMTQLDIISSVYLQPLSTFNKVVNGIANVCFLVDRRGSWLTITHRSIHTLRWH